MPLPFHCIECDKPVSQPLNGVCEECSNTQEEE